MTLDDYLMKHRLTLSALGQRAGVSPSTLHHLRRGSQAPSLGVALALEVATEGQVGVRDWGHLPQISERVDLAQRLVVALGQVSA
jgi:transcriptional regulator with XRE-family HTH domain